MSYILTMAELASKKAIAEESNKNWRNLSTKQLRKLKAELISEAKKNNFEPFIKEGLKMNVKFIEANEKGEEEVGPFDLGDILRAGNVAANGGLVVVAKSTWDMPVDYSEENAKFLMAGNVIKKGMNPTLVNVDEWNEYYAPIKEVVEQIQSLRQELSPLAKSFGITLSTTERLKKETELEALQEKQKALNCLRPNTFKKWSDWLGGAEPFYYDGSEAGLYSSCLKIRLADFNSEEAKAKRSERLQELAVIYLTEKDGNWRNRPDADNLRLSFDAEGRTKEAEDKAAVDEATSLREWLFKRYAAKMTGFMNNQSVFAGETLDEYNATSRITQENTSLRGTWEEGKVVGFKANDHRGWGETLYPKFVKGYDYKTVIASPSTWNKYAISKSTGKPMTVFGLIWMTIEFIALGMDVQDYLDCTGVSQKELLAYVARNAAREKRIEGRQSAGVHFAAKFAVKKETHQLVTDTDTPF